MERYDAAVSKDMQIGSVMAIDLRGFGTFSTRSKAHEIDIATELLFEPVERIARRNGGRFLKEMGDAEFFSFNVETPLKSVRDGAIAAVKTGLQMQEAMKKRREELLAEDRFSWIRGTDILLARIGIATDEVIYRQREVDGTLVKDIRGQAMTVAKRLETASKEGTVYVDQRTMELAGERFIWDPKGVVEVKEQRVMAYRAVEEKQLRFDVRTLDEKFFGREKEREAIRTYILNGGDPVLVRGPSGIGKTALAEEAMGARTIVPFNFMDRTTPLSLLRNFYRNIFGNDVKGVLSKLDLAEEYPWVALPLGIDTETAIPDDPEVRLMKMAEAYHKIRRIFDVVLFDDVQNADPLSLQLMASADERNVLTAREDFEPKFPVQVLDIPPLGEKESKQIVEGFLGEYFSELKPDDVDSILKRSGGNAYYTTQIAISLRERREREGRLDYKAALAELPEEMRSFIVSRAKDQGPIAYKAIKVASHLFRKWFYAKDVEEVMGDALDDELLKQLGKAGILVSQGAKNIEVADEKLLEAVYEATTPDERVKIHRALGEHFEKEIAKQGRIKALIANAATQFARSDTPEKAVGYLMELGVTDRDAGATETSAEHLKKVIEILDGQPDNWEVKRKKLEALRELGITYREMGLQEERRDVQKKRLEISGEIEIDIKKNKYQAVAAIADTLLASNVTKALELFESARKMAEEAGDKISLTAIKIGLSGGHLDRKEFEEARKLYNEVLEEASQQNNMLFVHYAHNGLGLGYMDEGKIEEAEREYRLAFDAAQKIGDKGRMAAVKRNLAYLYEKKGDQDGVLNNLVECLKLSEESGNKERLLFSLGGVMSILTERRESQAALKYLAIGEKIIRTYPTLKKTVAGEYMQIQIERLKQLIIS